MAKQLASLSFPRIERMPLVLAAFFLLGAVQSDPDSSLGQEYRQRAIRHSDVVFMYDNPEMYEVYGCTVLGWAGSQSAERIRLAHERGVRLFAVSIGFRTEFARMIDFTPQFMEATCRNFAGEPFIVPWLWDHKHKGQPAWWFCTNSPLYREYLYSRLRQVIDAGTDALHIDDYTGTAGAVTWLDACFCPACMEGFRQYLQAHLSEERKKELDLGDLATFDYRRYLSEKGITPQRYRAERPRLPLAAEFLDFHVKAATHFVAEFRRRASEWKGSHMPLAVNSSLSNPMNLAITPHLDYFCSEVDHQSAKREVPLYPIYVYKLADALGKPVTSTASGQDWADIAENKLPGLVRTWIALSYAFGHNFMAPHRQWCYTKEKGTHWYSGPPDEYAPLYRFVRNCAAFLDDFEPVAKVAVVYDNHSQRQGRGPITGICTALAEANVPFAILVEGDDWLLGYQLDEEMLRPYAAVVIPEGIQPSARLAAVLERLGASGNVVRWSSREQVRQFANRWVTVEPADELLVSVRQKADAKALAVHLVNRQYEASRDGMIPSEQVQLWLASELLPGSPQAVKCAVFHAPGEQPREVPVIATNAGVRIEVGEVVLWAIGVLRWE